MNDLLIRLLGATLGLSLSALAVQALVAMLRPSSPKVQQAAWFLVLFQGLVLFHLPVRLPWYEPTAVRGSPDSAHVRIAGLQETQGDVRSDDGGVGRPTPNANFGDAEPPIPVPEGPTQLHWQWIAWALWLGGMALLAIFSGLAYVLFLRRLSFGQPGHQEWADQWQRLIEERGISRSIALVVTEGVGPALYWTPRGYRVCVPRLTWAKLTAGQRLAILRHELAHFERSDLWALLLARLMALPHSKEWLQGRLNAPWRDPGDRSSSTGPEKGAAVPATPLIAGRTKPSAMTWRGDNLVVETTEARHRQIVDSLEAIRRHGAASFRIRTLFMTAPPETLDQAGVKWTVLSSDYPTDSAADQGLSPPFRPLGGSLESPSNWSRLVIEKIQPMMLEIADEDRGARLLEQWQKDRKVNVLQTPTIGVFSGQWAMASDGSRSPFVVGLKAVGLDESQPQIRVVSEGTVLQLRPLVDRQGKLRLDFVVTFSRIRSVDTFPVRSDTIIQVPEVETTRIQSTVDLPLKSWLLLRGPQRKVESEAAPSWSNWLSFLGVPRKPDRAKYEELLVMVRVEKLASRQIASPKGGEL